ncbi:rhodanese-like domain-containing protein [Methylobacterium nonmethylotrophicum]|uniref:Rhodanese-related sulfurtransferase n=1 Tax=Methylobacterium nonmethylotrophicum TaxID=1141884 RepID=A0A4Z0NVG9_9HYPH|nr:rhodanese-like domain-containing protein [Methylobacterium nonmethylotrophicum]TGE01283.1 rhodanese-related sulfurtransferase [Methylobacterium nonmethylotrophicum]
MTRTITARDLRARWAEGREIALLDVREEGPFAEAHPLFALSVPVSEVETAVPALLPRLAAPVVIYDAGEGFAARAAARIAALGYRDVAILEGGLAAYARVGEVYRDVNVPSKAFGELVEAIRHTPSLPAAEIRRILDEEQDVVVVDARRFEEFSTMSIPGGRSLPGGELVYRIREAAPSPDTLVVVNCAGRTRSIIGTQSLVNAGLPNRVVALRNGTIGWTLEGLPLATRRTERVAPPSAETRAWARERAGAWAAHVGVPVIGAEDLARFRAEADARTLYTLDVRDPAEYALGHPAGFASAPGGQLVQATDEWLGVRGARVVLFDDDGVRARMAASWLLQMGWDVFVLAEDAALPETVPVPEPARATCPTEPALTPDGLAARTDATVVDLARSPAYRRGHVPGAWYASGPALARDLAALPGDGPVVLTSPDGRVAAANLAEARAATGRPVLLLAGGTRAWTESGRPLETEGRFLSEPIDVYKRPYEGTDNARAAMQGYIDWELQLVAQLASDGIARFHVARAPDPRPA